MNTEELVCSIFRPLYFLIIKLGFKLAYLFIFTKILEQRYCVALIKGVDRGAKVRKFFHFYFATHFTYLKT